jgi:D-alanyl-D-alanine carboxypeptidase/D-alanyl-D-alanine-endopeptidase (penicillin-binding protein 4)
MPHYAIKLYSLPIDTLLRRMMKESDNMLAEHLLLASGMEVMDTLSSSETIKWSKTTLISDIPHKPIWVDGSGLSRYNKCTPSSILYLLKKMYREIDEKKLFSLLLEGGNLTLKSMDATEIKPFVFAKTGSMTGVYNLSGYLITSKGKKLAFSFMNNNFNGKVSTVKKAVEKILLDVWRAN